jgi:hypothetical protein
MGPWVNRMGSRSPKAVTMDKQNKSRQGDVFMSVDSTLILPRVQPNRIAGEKIIKPGEVRRAASRTKKSTGIATCALKSA